MRVLVRSERTIPCEARNGLVALYADKVHLRVGVHVERHRLRAILSGVYLGQHGRVFFLNFGSRTVTNRMRSPGSYPSSRNTKNGPNPKSERCPPGIFTTPLVLDASKLDPLPP